MAGRLLGSSGASQGWSARKEEGTSHDLLHLFAQPCSECLGGSRGILLRCGHCLLSTCSGQLLSQMNFEYLAKRRQYCLHLTSEEGVSEIYLALMMQSFAVEFKPKSLYLPSLVSALLHQILLPLLARKGMRESPVADLLAPVVAQRG